MCYKVSAVNLALFLIRIEVIGMHHENASCIEPTKNNGGGGGWVGVPTTTGVRVLINPPTYCSKVGLYFFNEDVECESFRLRKHGRF